jgi:two-component system, sensor histidine kinase RegB
MTEYDHPDSGDSAARSNWVPLRTLVLLRWMAIAGQSAAILIAWRFFDIAIDTLPCLAVIGFSAILNLVFSLYFPENRRLSQLEALGVLIFDSCQLALLLYLTGGLNNPFALLILAPATIAATALQDRATAIIGALTLVLVSILAVAHVPLRLTDGSIIAVPRIFGFGFWLALVIGVMFLGLYARRVTRELQVMSEGLLATQMALARAQKLTDLSGVVAAAAHELGTPLATIKLASSELADELADRPLLREDAELIRDQADRCRDILRSMGRAGKDDLHLRTAPFAAVVEEAAEPHSNRGAKLHIHLPTDRIDTQPNIRRRPEVIHGLRNLVQNAVDFSRGDVWIDLDWSDTDLSFLIVDSGPGFPSHLLGRIGDPFMRHRPPASAAAGGRREYEGMGLGLFIAKTLLERTGATLQFSNASDPFLTEDERPQKSGAMIRVSWPRHRIQADSNLTLGQNQLISR